MVFQLNDQVAVVTGAASGIGGALADVLAKRGCHLALADIDAGGLETVAGQARQHGVTVSTHILDVADAGAVAALPKAVVDAHCRVSVLVNNAGVALGGTFEEVSETDFDWLIAINLFGTIRMTRAFLPLLRQARAAHIVNLSSLFGIIAPPGQVAYATSKFGVRGFSEALRHELMGSPIGLTVVHPGGVKTNIAANARHQSMSDAEKLRQRKSFERLLTLSPAIAADEIVKAIERRDKRLIIGKDAKRATLIQRLFPVRYWSIIERAQ